jgi:hypothetical protein
MAIIQHITLWLIAALSVAIIWWCMAAATMQPAPQDPSPPQPTQNFHQPPPGWYNPGDKFTLV